MDLFLKTHRRTVIVSREERQEREGWQERWQEREQEEDKEEEEEEEREGGELLIDLGDESAVEGGGRWPRALHWGFVRNRTDWPWAGDTGNTGDIGNTGNTGDTGDTRDIGNTGDTGGTGDRPQTE